MQFAQDHGQVPATCTANISKTLPTSRQLLLQLQCSVLQLLLAK
jgi:hypothetical protein